MQSVLFIVNTGPYQGEFAYNALRLAAQLPKRGEVQVRIFLQSEAVYAAMPGQNPPHLQYRVDQMLEDLIQAGAVVRCCGVCMDARALADGDLIEGAARGTMAELGDWTLAADKVLVF